ncbi:hypothetical protein Pyn_16510 [Prunus yedoensis var. nudiflora]|uniref:Uncharacterized protein n=1 Tax=Prunus yedoensis var. nudiflora TaxID=2094558 RepID=A0A315B6N0_PRUYE|nr:hypothetical protein Pyn_16510 [Prunus yedoensis var. nudiflora]
MLRKLRFRNSVRVTAPDEALQIVLLWLTNYAQKCFSKDQKSQKLALPYWLEAKEREGYEVTVENGKLVHRQSGMLVDTAIWPYSDYYYLATEDNFKEFISFLQEHHVDLTHVEMFATDDENASIQIPDKLCLEPEMNKSMESNGEAPINYLSKCLSWKWATGVGPRIGCVREYPSELRFRALEHNHNQSQRSGSHLGLARSTSVN